MIPRLFQSPKRLGLPSWSIGLSGDRPAEARYGQKFANIETGEIDEWIGDRWRIVAQHIIGLPELTDALIHWHGSGGGGVYPAPRSPGDPSITDPVMSEPGSDFCCSGNGAPVAPPTGNCIVYRDDVTDNLYFWDGSSWTPTGETCAFNATDYIFWEPHFWQGNFGMTGAINCAGKGYSQGNFRDLTPGITYNYWFKGTWVNVDADLGQWQVGQGVSTSTPCGVPFYNPNSVEETVASPQNTEVTGSFLAGSFADHAYVFASGDHHQPQNGTTPSGHMEFWVDPVGYVPAAAPTPTSGQAVINDTTTQSANGVRTSFTLVLGSVVGYQAGTLVVFFDGIEQDGFGSSPTEVSPAGGTFSFAVPPANGIIITAEYVAA